MLAPKTRPGGVPHRLLGVIFEVFEVVSGLGRSGRWLGGLSGLLSGSWVTSGGVLGGLGEVLDVMLAPKIAANPQKIGKKCGSKRQAVPEWFFDGFLIEDKQPGTPKVCI